MPFQSITVTPSHVYLRYSFQSMTFANKLSIALLDKTRKFWRLVNKAAPRGKRRVLKFKLIRGYHKKSIFTDILDSPAKI